MLPMYFEDTIEQLLSSNDSFAIDSVFLLAQTRFEIKQLEIMGEIILIFEMSSFDELLSCIDQELSLISQS
jgi:chemotaxis protein CheC